MRRGGGLEGQGGCSHELRAATFKRTKAEAGRGSLESGPGGREPSHRWVPDDGGWPLASVRQPFPISIGSGQRTELRAAFVWGDPSVLPVRVTWVDETGHHDETFDVSSR